MNVDIEDEDSNTALIRASRYGNEESVRFLLDRNANLDIMEYYAKQH